MTNVKIGLNIGLKMNFDVLVGLVATLFLIHSSAATTPYLGCYNDVDGANDLADLEMTFTPGELTVTACVDQCRENGAPFAGIRRARTCYCGMEHGRYGLADNINCNYTCQGDSGLQYCGGNQANSVYYTIDIETTRQTWAHGNNGDVDSFKNARQKCVRTDGDLLSILDYSTINDTIATQFADFQLTADQRKFWVGLKWQYIPSCGLQVCDDAAPADSRDCTYYDWVNPVEVDFSCVDFAVAWRSGETFRNDCVIVDMDTGKFETTHCLAQYPFLCNSVDETDEESIAYDEYESESKAKDDSNSLVALYIVMPLFVFCYGGSCILYCIHKIYRNCKRRRKDKMLLEDQEEDFTEFEPDTKPKPPVDTSRPEPLFKKKPSNPFFFGSRPATGGDVRISMASSPPGIADVDSAPAYYERTTLREKVNKMRLEKRRSRLLENALKEARERRAKEKSDLSMTTTSLDEPTTIATLPKPTPSGTPVHSMSSSTVMKTPKRSARGDRSSRYRKADTPTDFSPSSSLMGDDRNSESPDDPTTMSIADIMRVKMMMKEKKKRVRKILSS